MKAKIGILTYHHSYNFGANLQTLATQSMLKKRDVEPIVVNFQDQQKVASFKKIVSQEQAEQHEAFFKDFYKLGPLITEPEQIEDYCLKNLDGLIVGSDAVFRLAAKYSPRRIAKRLLGRDSQYASFSNLETLSPFWLHWNKKTKGTSFAKSSLAASSRSTPFMFLKPKMMLDVRDAINDFDYVTVRDHWTRKMLRWLTLGSCPVDICHDPVFGLNSAFQLPPNAGANEDLSKTILVSVDVSSHWRTEFKRLANEKGYSVKVLPSAEDYFPFPEANGEVPLPMSPLDWYANLASAAGYIGFRFHALVSCMSNETPVVTVDTGQSLLKGADRKSPCYYTCKEAGILQRYFTKKGIRSSSPQQVLEILFDESLQEKANAFSKESSRQVNQAIDNSIEKLTQKVEYERAA